MTEHPPPARPAPHVRFVDPSGPAVLVRAVRLVVGGLARGAAVSLGLAVVLGILVEEAMPYSDQATALDLVARTWAGVTLAVAGAAAVSLPLLHALERALLLRRAERDLAARPAAVPLSSTMAVLGTAPSLLVARLLAVVAGTAAVGGLILVLLTVTDDAEETTTPLVVCAATVLVWLVLRGPLRRARERWDARVRAFESLREPLAAEAERAEAGRRQAAPRSATPDGLRPRSPRWLRVALGVVVPLEVLAVVLWFVPVMTRQPCRRCDPRTYGEAVETWIDTGTVATTVLLVAATSLLLTLLAVRFAFQVAAGRRLRRWVADASPRRVPDEDLVALRFRPRPAVTAVHVLASLVPVVLGAVLGGAWAADDVGLAPPSPLRVWLAVGLLGGSLAFALFDATVGRQQRDLLRRALLPGDDAPDETEDADAPDVSAGAQD